MGNGVPECVDFPLDLKSFDEYIRVSNVCVYWGLEKIAMRFFDDGPKLTGG